MRKREAVPVERAIMLYDRFKSWQKVSRVLRRNNGMSFTASGLFNAVRRYDLRRAA